MKEPRAAAAAPAPQIMSELRVSGHLMLLEPGLFCVVQAPSRGADSASGLPGVRLSPAPGPAGRPDSVTISGFAPDGWLSSEGDAALVRVSGAAAQVLVTIYQAQDAQDGTAPNIQVTRLLDGSGYTPARPSAPPQTVAGVPTTAPARQAARAAAMPIGAAAPPQQTARVMEMVAHFQSRGDVGAMVGEWLGGRGSRLWIEGFAVAPTSRIAPADIEYQAVLGPGWLSPWVEGGQYCGSRGMALPVLGLRVRLRGAAAEAYHVQTAATFVDGTEIGPVDEGEPCEAANLVALESFRIDLLPRLATEQPSPLEAAPARPAKAPPRARAVVPAAAAAAAKQPVAVQSASGKPAARGRGGWPPPAPARPEGKKSKR